MLIWHKKSQVSKLIAPLQKKTRARGQNWPTFFNLETHVLSFTGPCSPMYKPTCETLRKPMCSNSQARVLLCTNPHAKHSENPCDPIQSRLCSHIQTHTLTDRNLCVPKGVIPMLPTGVGEWGGGSGEGEGRAENLRTQRLASLWFYYLFYYFVLLTC